MGPVEKFLRDSKALIEDPANHCTHAYARNKNNVTVLVTSPAAVKFCAFGAMARINGGFDGSKIMLLASEELEKAAIDSTQGISTVIGINEWLSHCVLMDVWDIAIISAAKKGI